VIEVLDAVQFTDDGVVQGAGYQTLDAVASTLQGNPGILLVEIQGRVVDDDGQGEGGREARAQQRADLVMAYLVKAGVAPERLTAKGYTDLAKADASHVAFLITKRSEPAPAPAPAPRPDVSVAPPIPPTPVAEKPVTSTTAVTPPGPTAPATGAPAPSSDAELRASKAFLSLVEGARPAIRDCYLKAKVATGRVSLLITTQFTRAGDLKSSTGSPALGATFDACMKTVTAGWKIGAQAEDSSFQTTVILDP